MFRLTPPRASSALESICVTLGAARRPDWGQGLRTAISGKKNYSQNGPRGARFELMSAHHLTREYQNPIVPRSEDDDEDDEAAVKTTPAPVGAMIQKKFLEQRKIFLWGAVTDETAKDLTEKLLYLETTGPGK